VNGTLRDGSCGARVHSHDGRTAPTDEVMRHRVVRGLAPYHQLGEPPTRAYIRPGSLPDGASRSLVAILAPVWLATAISLGVDLSSCSRLASSACSHGAGGDRHLRPRP
jgi:hypothetical protein